MSERFANSVGFDAERRDGAPAEHPSVLGPGDKVGPYVLEARIGQGGMGEVWRARAGNGPAVALKVALKPEGRDALRRQGAAQRKLFHGSIVRVLDEDLAHEPPYVVFELVEGQNLRARLEDMAHVRVSEMVPRWRLKDGEAREGETGPACVHVVRSRALSPAERTERLAGILRQIASGLAHAHGCGIVHGDLKPENVLISTDGRALLTDFGLGTTACAEVSLSRSLATASFGGGTFAYLAPERHMGGKPTPESDVWSFGIMLFEACHGRLPQGFERPHGWLLAPTFAACYAPADDRLRSGAQIAGSLGAALLILTKKSQPARAVARPSSPARPAYARRRARFTALEGVGVALCLVVGCVASIGWISGGAEALTGGRGAEARRVEETISPAARAQVMSLLRETGDMLRRSRRDRSGVVGVSSEWTSIQTAGETVQYRIVPDWETGTVAAYPRVEGRPVLSLQGPATGLASGARGGRMR